MANVGDTELSKAGRAMGRSSRGARTKQAADRKLSERQLLLAFIREFGPEDIRAVARAVKLKALEGDKDAIAVIGKFAMGGGRITADDCLYPPSVRRTR